MRKILTALFMCIWFVPCVAGTFTSTDETERDRYIYRAKASLFLSRASFGPTMTGDIPALNATQIQALPETDILNLAADIEWEIENKTGGTDLEAEKRAYAAWIDKQIALPVTSHLDIMYKIRLVDGTVNNDSGSTPRHSRHKAWWHISYKAEDQLRQRMAWALAQIFVAVDNGAGSNDDYFYDLFVHGAFDNYRNLISDITLHTRMGIYLSFVSNPKGDPTTNRSPDENYAREVLQLFSIGLYELNLDGSKKLLPAGCGVLIAPGCQPIATYDNETIKQFARVFTGLSYARSKEFGKSPANVIEPMQMYENAHDIEEKRLLNGTVLPAGQMGMQDIQDALDNIFQHPNVGPFIAKKLIQRLVMSNPSKSYVANVASAFNDSANNGKNRGDFENVIRAILLDDVALTSYNYDKSDDGTNYTATVSSKGVKYTRLREPSLRHAALYRAFVTSVLDKGEGTTCPGCFPDGIYSVGSVFFEISPYGQVVNQFPHVFNYYFPDYQPPGELANIPTNTLTDIPDAQLFAPEFQILNAVSAIEMAEAARGVRSGHIYTNSTELFSDYLHENALAADTPALVRRINLLMCNAGMSALTTTMLSDKLEEFFTPTNAHDGVPSVVSLAILSTFMAPECAVH